MPYKKTLSSTKIKDVLKISALPVIFASLCCLSPVILVLFGLSTVTFAASLSDTLYGEYKWYFRLAGFLLLLASLFFYYRRKGICTLDKAKKHKNEIINTFVIVFISFVVGYVLFLYVVVDWLGILLNIW